MDNQKRVEITPEEADKARKISIPELNVTFDEKDLLWIKFQAVDELVNRAGYADVTYAWTVAVMQRLQAKLRNGSDDSNNSADNTKQ